MSDVMIEAQGVTKSFGDLEVPASRRSFAASTSWKRSTADTSLSTDSRLA